MRLLLESQPLSVDSMMLFVESMTHPFDNERLLLEHKPVAPLGDDADTTSAGLTEGRERRSRLTASESHQVAYVPKL
jgi:hypothetical protein